MTTAITTTDWGQTARNQGWERPPLLPVLHCALVFFGRNASHIFSGTTQLGVQQFSWNPRQKVSALLKAHILTQGIKHFFIQAEVPGLSHPVSAAHTHTPLRSSQDKAGCCMEQLPEPLRGSNCLSENKALDWTVGCTM